uniref:Uncharacterized protein n=1 Tax=Oryza glumipatula TaxID=40148 RepID=A0A0E0B8X0_9ORYZ
MSPSSNRHRICNKKSIRLEKRNVSRHRPPSSSASEDVRSLPLASVLFLRQDLIAFTTAVVQSNLSNGKRSAVECIYPSTFCSLECSLDVLIWRRTSYLAAHTNVLFSKRHVWLCKCSLRRSATTSSAELVCLAIHAMAAWRSQGLLAAHELVGIWISRYYNDISVFFHEAGEIYSFSATMV